MKTFPNVITNPYLKLIYIDLYQIALENKGVIPATSFQDVLSNPSYKEVRELYYPETSIKVLSKTISSLFLTSITKIFVTSKKEFGLLLKDVGNYFFQLAYDDWLEQDFLNSFIQNGIDPMLFLKVALRETKRATKYQFSTLSEIFSVYVKEDEKREERKLAKLNEDIEGAEVKIIQLDYLLEKKGEALIAELKTWSKKDLAELFENVFANLFENGLKKEKNEDSVKEISLAEVEVKKKQKIAQQRAKTSRGEEIKNKLERLQAKGFEEKVNGLLTERDEKQGIFRVKEKGLVKSNRSVSEWFYFGNSVDWEIDEHNAKECQRNVRFHPERLNVDNIFEKIISSNDTYFNETRKTVIDILVKEGRSASSAESAITKLIADHGSAYFYNAVKVALNKRPIPVNFLAYCAQVIYAMKNGTMMVGNGNGVVGQENGAKEIQVQTIDPFEREFR